MSMAIPATLPPPGQALNKRKHPDTTTTDISPKKKRVAIDPSEYQSPSLEPYRPLLAALQTKYEVQPMSVVSSTSISKHINKALAHLGRFSFLDDSVLPGVVLLYAKSKAANKVVTVAETIRRRIAEGDQKWYQYNVLYEIASPAGPESEPSMIEDTMLVDEDDGQEEKNIESTGPTIFESAVEPAELKNQSIMSVFISRVPIAELLPFCSTGAQTNAHDVEKKRKVRLGLP